MAIFMTQGIGNLNDKADVDDIEEIPETPSPANNAGDATDGDDGEDVDPEDPEVDEIMQAVGTPGGVLPADVPIQNQNRWWKVKQIVKDFALSSSIHGIGHIGHSHNIFVLIFWGTILVICGLVLAVLVVLLVANYLKYERMVTIMMRNDDLHFPSVTVCNINPYKKSEVAQHQSLQTLVKAFNMVKEQERNG